MSVEHPVAPSIVPTRAPRNQFRHTQAITTPVRFRDGQWRSYEPPSPVERTLLGRPWLLRPGLTFTPYANPTRCNAHCAFCSEELLRIDANRLSARHTIDDHDRYFSALDRAWRALAGLDMGLSLSGLEATSDSRWLLRLLALLDEHPSLFNERVLYSNGSGLASDSRLAPALARARFDRVELSRAHMDERRNQRIMRFDLGQPIRRHVVFEETVRRARAEGLSIKLVCILNDEGVSTIDDVERYLDACEALGVDRVVFRELAALGDLYRPSRETRWIERHRVSARALMDQIYHEEGPKRASWTLEGVTAGYYYYNEVYRRAHIEVTLEASSYVAHREAVASGVLQKLVFHSTRVLSGDWVPNVQVIGSFD